MQQVLLLTARHALLADARSEVSASPAPRTLPLVTIKLLRKQELGSAHSADIRFILATKVELFAAEGGQHKPRGSLCGSLRGSV